MVDCFGRFGRGEIRQHFVSFVEGSFQLDHYRTTADITYSESIILSDYITLNDYVSLGVKVALRVTAMRVRW